MINYCTVVAFLTSVFMLLRAPTQRNIEISVALLVVLGITSLAAFLKRRKILCPLCKGTPLIGSKARIHPKAKRIFPLAHSTSSMVTLIFTQTFCCMHCASQFDLLKSRNSGQRKQEEEEEEPG